MENAEVKALLRAAFLHGNSAPRAPRALRVIPCGSKKKFKRCCWLLNETALRWSVWQLSYVLFPRGRFLLVHKRTTSIRQLPF